MICFHCGAKVFLEGKIYRSDVCPKCEADVHCCVNCDQYEPTAHNKCLEPQAEWVTDREKANYCDFFVARKETRNLIVKQRDSARLDFDNLFKKQ